MAVISQKGKVGLRLQAARLGYLSRDGAPSPNVINMYPLNNAVMAINATTVDVSPAIDQRMLDPEVGGTLFNTGAMRLGYSVAGTWTIQPRMEDNFGWILYALCGKILAEYFDSVRVVGEHTFIMSEDEAAGNLPWLTFVKYMPGIGTASDAFEFHEDSRIVQAAVNIPANGLVTVDLTERGRVFGLTGQQKLIDRSVLVGPVAPVDSALSDADALGTINTVLDAGAFVQDGLVGSRVFFPLYGYRDIVGNTTGVITFSPSVSAAIEIADEYTPDLPIWRTASADGAVDGSTIVDTGFTGLAINALAGARIYVTGVGFRTVVSNTAASGTGVLTLDQPLPAMAATGTRYCVASAAMGGNIRTVRVNSSVYAAINVNDWISVDGKGVRRVTQKVVDEDGYYVIRIDGEFDDEVALSDAVIVLSPTEPDANAVTNLLVDTSAAFTEGQYDGYWLEVWDANGDSIGKLQVVGTIEATDTLHVAGDFAVAPTAGMSYALFMPEVAFTWLPKECPMSIPQSPFPESHFKVLDEPFGGRKQPVRSITITVGYQVLPVEREMLVGAYEQDDITVQSATPTQLRYVYRVKSQELYTYILTGGSIEAQMKRFNPQVFTSDVFVSTAAPAEVTTGHYYRMEWFFGNVAWQLDGAPRLTGNDVVELNFTGTPFEPCGVTNPIVGPLTIAAAADVNTVTGAITHADLDDLVEGDLVGKTIRITTGTGAGQVRQVKAYRDGTSEGTIIPHRPWITNPDDTSIFVLEAHYAMVTLTNKRSKYGDDVPTLI